MQNCSKKNNNNNNAFIFAHGQLVRVVSSGNFSGKKKKN